ncbi:MAG: DUF2791 family P-loop domain-containing protein [Thermoplasmata archaeon]
MDTKNVLQKPIFVGRNEEFKKLKEYLERAVGGKGQFVFIEGEAGIGKTRLVHELKEYAETKGVKFLSGKCLYHEGSDPYLPFLEALREHLSIKNEKVNEESPAPIGFIGQIVHNTVRDTSISLPVGLIKTGMAEDTSKRELDLRKERDRMFEIVLQLIIRISQESPLILFIDDLQWADIASLQLLYYLGRNIKESRTLIACTYRPEDLLENQGKAHPLTDIIKRMSREGLYAKVTLRRLSQKDSSLMISSLLNIEKIPEGLVKLVYEHTEGNPFFIEEVLKSLVEDGIIDTKDRTWHFRMDLSKLSLPATIKDIVTRRVDRLSEDAEKVLEVAATIGREFSFDILLAAIEGDEEALLDAIDELIESRLIIEESNDNREEYRFDHPTVREVVYNSLSRGKKRLLHRKVALALESVSKGKESEKVYNLAYHFYNANEYEKALLYAQKAGERAIESFAPEDALRYYKMALDSIEKLQDNDSNKLRKLSLLRSIGKLCYSLADWNEGIAYYGSMLELSVELKNDHSRAEAHRGLGKMCSEQNIWQDAISHFECAIAISEKLSDLHGLGEAMRGRGWIDWMLGKYDSALELYRKALSCAESIGDVRVIAQTYIDIGNVYNVKGEFSKAIWHYEKSLDLLEEMDEEYEIARVYNNLADVHNQMKELEKSLEYYMKCIESSEKSKNNKFLMYGSQGAGEVLANLGRLEDAERYTHQAMKMAIKTDDKYLIAAAHRGFGIIYGKKKAWDLSAEHFNKAMKILEEKNIQHYLAQVAYDFALMYKNKGDFENTKKYLKKSIEVYESVGAKELATKLKAEYEEVVNQTNNKS